LGAKLPDELKRRKKESALTLLKRRRKSDKDRQERFRQKQLAAGKRPITVYISQEALNILNHEKGKTGETNSEIIERAILNLKPKLKRRKKG